MRSGPTGRSGPIDRFGRPGMTLTLVFGQIKWNWPSTAAASPCARERAKWLANVGWLASR